MFSVRRVVAFRMAPNTDVSAVEGLLLDWRPTPTFSVRRVVAFRMAPNTDVSAVEGLLLDWRPTPTFSVRRVVAFRMAPNTDVSAVEGLLLDWRPTPTFSVHGDVASRQAKKTNGHHRIRSTFSLVCGRVCEGSAISPMLKSHCKQTLVPVFRCPRVSIVFVNVLLYKKYNYGKLIIFTELFLKKWI